MGLVVRIFWFMMLVWMINVAMEVARGRIHLLVIIASFIFFQLCNAAVDHSVRNKSLRIEPADSSHVFINTSVSLIHSLILSCSVAACLAIEFRQPGRSVNQMLEFESLYSNAWPGAYSLLAFSCGYFAYDQVDMLRRGLHQLSLLIHHWLLLNCFTLALIRDVSINYLILTLLCEMHSVFLHWRRVGRMHGARKLIPVEWLFNWTTFFTSRLIVHLVISQNVYSNAARFPSKLELLLASSGMLGLNVLNLLLGLDLARACFRELMSSRRKKQA